MTQGTISVFIGCHSIIHSMLVVIAWKKLYKRFPKFQELVCIFLHDIGHIGLNYLDDVKQKEKHWELGAEIASLFGVNCYRLVAGHCSTSQFPKSNLYKPDKYSWYIAPKWWLYWNALVEPKLRGGLTIKNSVKKFQEQVKDSIETGEFKSTHLMYLERSR